MVHVWLPEYRRHQENLARWGPTVDFRRLSTEEAPRSSPTLWNTARQALPDLPLEQVAIVASLASDTCQWCHAENRRCWCEAADERRAGRG